MHAKIRENQIPRGSWQSSRKGRYEVILLELCKSIQNKSNLGNKHQIKETQGIYEKDEKSKQE